MKKGLLKKGIATTLAAVMLSMSTIPYLPVDILTSWAFYINFRSSGQAGHPDIFGQAPGDTRAYAFFCLNKGASAKATYDYYKVNADINYSEGTLEQKRMFWAYILTHGSADNNSTLTQYFGMPLQRNTLIGKEVSWSYGSSNGGSALIDNLAKDGFMSLENIPAGCKSPNDIFNVVSNYNTPDTAISINAVKNEPNLVDAQKLYDLAGIDNWETFLKYCTISAEPIVVTQGGKETTYNVNITTDEYGFRYHVVDPSGIPSIIPNRPPVVIKVEYNPAIFKVINVTGTLEYFKCDEAGSQQLYRAKGKVEVTNPVFYMTEGPGYKPPGGGGESGSGGGGLDGGETISVDIYEHKETFESNYKVDLTKKDYETGHPLKDSIWQVLEAFPDQAQLGTDETDGGLVEDKMREDPTTWENWLIFEDDMSTNTEGYISHADKRYYDFSHKYCDGHPIPPEPEDEGGGEGGDGGEDEDDGYAQLLAQWQAAVDECVGVAEASNGTFHHWECGSETKPSESEAFESSGCKAARDAAYDNFINLRYSYTFREVDARDGYIIHGQNGHPDDVPIEIITTASSESGKAAEWTTCSNEDIVVTGYARDYISGNEGDEEEIALMASPFSSNRMLKKRASDSNIETGNVYLTEQYDLTTGQKAVNALRRFFGLPEQYATESDFVIKIIAEYDEVKTATPSEAEKSLEDEIELENDLSNPSDENVKETAAANESSPEESIQGTETESSSAPAEETNTSESEPKIETTESTTTESETVPETTVSKEKETTEDENREEVKVPEEKKEKEDEPEVSISEKDIPVVRSSYIIDEDEDESYYNEDINTATSSNAKYSYRRTSENAISLMTDEEEETAIFADGGGGFINLEGAFLDSQPEVNKGPSDNLAHSFIVYDHRVPGQIHFNKKDMELATGENDAYDAYGDTQGDSTLEGAVYGLFAADDIYGPDTQRDENGDVIKGTGIIFDANDLVAVAATDKNGDGSFLTITEKPHSIYNYKEGEIQYTGKAYPKNLYDKDGYEKIYNDEETGRIYKDNLNVNGDYWIGRPLILGNYYIKELSRSEGFELSITGKDMEVTNANDTNRGDYGETDDSKSHPVGSAWIVNKLSHAVTFPEGNDAYGNRENLFGVTIGSNGTINGFDVIFDGIPEGADFYYDNVETNPVKVQIPVGGEWVDATEEPLYEQANSSTLVKRDQNGNPVTNPNAVKDFPVSYSGVGYKAKEIPENANANATDSVNYNAAFVDNDSNINYVKYELEQMMRSMGISTPKDKDSGKYSEINYPVYDESRTGYYGMPEVVLEISNVSTNASVINAILDYYVENKVYTYGSLQQISMSGNNVTVKIAIGMSPKKTTLYQTNDAGDIIAGYLFKLNEKTGRYIMRKYTGTNVAAVPVPGATDKCTLVLHPDFIINADGTPENLLTYAPGTEYLYYTVGETLYDYWYDAGSGNWTGHSPIRRKVYQTIFEEQEITETNVSSSKVAMVGSREEVTDPIGSTYVYYDEVSKQYILHAGSKDVDLTGIKTSGFTVAIDNGQTTLTQADIDKIGNNNVWRYKVGDKLDNSAYIMRISGAGAGVSASESFDKDGSFIKNQTLVYNGNHNISEDGNTKESPNPVQERIIGQQIKVTKKIDKNSYNNTNSYSEVHDDWFTKTFGGLFGKENEARKMDNFRYKVYLKSNLERLYRDNDGNVIWQDRSGNEIDPIENNEKFPALVNKIYTKVQHVTDPLYKDSEDAIVKNEALYDYTDGLINSDQNAGYTAVLETIDRLVEDGTGTRVVRSYNYDKLYDAIAVANNDKWDDANPTYTTWQPIGNAANRTENAVENARVSDMVRQFAIDWYLDDEIKKLVKEVPNNAAEKEDKDGTVPYSDEMYDEALRNAIIKAENYLKPFFSYDIDRIYSIEWDSEEEGGSDKDLTTLSADTQFGDFADSGEGYYFATSEYLPYGTYVVAEQQPKYDNLEDFKNKHYQIDKPKEVVLPSVYADYDGSQASPEVLNSYYNYAADISQPEMERKYKIRFNEEAVHVIKGRNADGDFEVYKYGMDIDNVRNGVTGASTGDYFALTQDAFRPYKNYYNAEDDRKTGEVPYYLSEGLSGRTPVSKYYRYSSVAENKGTANDVPYPGGAVTEDNGAGIFYKDNVTTMLGVQTAYDGKYASMLVPWTIVASENSATEVEDSKVAENGESSYKGFDYTKFTNRLFTTKLRIEKLDSETHENILHDGAVFNIYAAKRNDAVDGNGAVLFYEKDTTISGTREFLEAMCATNITPMARKAGFIDRLTGKEYGAGNLYTGVVPAGTPVCEESEKIILGDSYGNQTVAFKSYSTVLDGEMKDEDTNTTLGYQNQTVGYVETPQPLGAGVYVICEAKAPSGYTRSNPIAVEVYSDKVTYYKEANKDERVLAAMYEYPSDNPTTNGNKPQDVINVARINVENAPIKLEVEKIKESSDDSADTTPDKTVTYKVSGRIDGSLAEIGNNPDYEYAYNDAGQYLGYAWKKGTLEYLVARKNAGEDVQIAYEGKIFAGYGFVTKTLETADDTNKYVAGATMTLFDALEITPSGDTQDHAYNGLVIERNSNNNIGRMYVKKGYAGTKVEFIKEKDEEGNEYTIEYQAGVDKYGNPIMKTGNIWTAETIERPDTDILYYDMDSLKVFVTKTVDGKEITYGYDKNYDLVPIDRIESDKINYPKTDTEYSIYAFKGGIPYLEFVGGDFKQIKYSATDKLFEVGEGTVIYHLDRDGNRDSMVDPYTGMAYVKENTVDAAGKTSERTLVWAVNVHKDEFGNVIARDKITTSRIATVGENEDGYNENVTIDVTNNSGEAIPDNEKPSYSHSESGYTTGTWKSDAGEESHKETTVKTNESGQNMNDDVLVDDNNGKFDKELNPTYDEHGLVGYYQRSDETYDKGTELYDRNGDFVRYQDSDNLEEYNNAAYRVNDHEELFDGDSTKETQNQKKLYHRQGEGYILENTWVTSDKTPNDPFNTSMTDGQPDVLKRVPAGSYILEEIRTPEGYLRGMPTGITVNETAAMQNVQMIDKTTKTEISKIDGTEKQTYNLVNMETGLIEGTVEEGKDSYGYGHVADAVIALYAARKVYTADFINYPNGYYLVRASEDAGPITYYSTESMVSNIRELTAKWTTGTTPIYIEGIPEGYYLLEELEAPEGFTISDPVEVYVSNTAEVQTVIMNDDHTKVEIAKHEITENGKQILSGAGFTLYKGEPDGSYNPADVVDSWMSDDATDYTDIINLKDYPNTSMENVMSGFRSEFEALYEEYGTKENTSIRWSVERKAERSSADDNVWILEDRTLVPVINNVINFPAGMSQEDRDGFYAAYLANTRNENTIKWAVEKTASYVSHTQIDNSTVEGNESTTDFPTTATMLFKTGDGQQVQITVYEETASAGKKTYTFEYKFDYKKLDTINKYACSYLTENGHRRFDYLPVDSTYVLVETTVPEGYAKAEDTVITVKDMLDVQYYSILNETTAIRISKVAEGKTGELVGAKLALYKAAADESLEQTDENLITSWVSGSDGTYTDTDFVNGLIPDGYSKGDLKPHTIRGLENGIYYLVEIDTPDYYTSFKPIRIDYEGEDEIQIVRATDKPVLGQLEINKTDVNDAPLSGVTFQITAYRKGTGEIIVDKYVSDTNGKVLVKDLPVGDISQDGTIVPYTYKVRETTPPDGFAASPVVKTFQFSPDKNGVSFEYGEFSEHNLKVVNEKTKIYIEKRNFTHLEDEGIDGAFVDGAVLAVYEITGRDDEDNYIYDENKPLDKWTSSTSEPRHMIEGLIAGRSYLLKELKAPAGYNLMKPVTFTVSSNGRNIYSITNKLNTVTVNYITPTSQHLDTDNLDIDSIDSITLTGRYVSKVDMVVTDASGNQVAMWTSDGKEHTLVESDGLVDGEVYTFTEYTCYSDGSRTVTDKTTKRITFDENGEFSVNTRAVGYTNIAIYWTDGTEITHYTPNEFVMSKTVQNNVSPENPKVTMKHRNGTNGDALNANQAVINTVSYANTANIKTDITITAEVGSTARIINPDGGEIDGNTITWVVKDVAPSTSGYVTFDTQITDSDAESTSVMATISFNGKTYNTKKETPIMKANRLTVYNELTGSGKELYADEKTEFKIQLYNELGNELKGIYAFTGSQSGELRSGDTITLAGNEFITIDPTAFYKNARYKVTRIEDGSQKTFTERNTEGIAAEDTGAFAVFSRNVRDTSEREIFSRGESYMLIETTAFSDGEIIESNKLQFTLNENASISGIAGYDKETHVSISKTDITTGEELPGAHIIIKDKDGNTIDEWVSTDKPHEITGMLTPGEEYTMIESIAPDGYAYAEEIKFTVNEDGTVDKVVMEDKKTHVVFRKTDITTGEELPGAHIVIKDKNGNIVEEWTSTDKPHEIVGKLVAGEEYTMVEVGPPDGYAYAADIKFTVSLDGTIDRVVMEDKPTHITISKTDITTGEELPGAHIIIKDKEGNIVDEWISTDQPHEIVGELVAGEEYTMIEQGAPDGYAYAEEIKFTVSKDGSIDKVVMEDKPTHVTISKTDITTGKELPGAHLVIKDKDGKVVDEWTSTDTPHEIVGKLIAGETYTLVETGPPDGYAYAAEVEFTVSLDGSIDKVVMEDKLTHVTITKTDLTTGEELPGAHIIIKDKDGNIVDEWISTDQPHEIVGELIAGEEYTMIESFAPDGYGYAEEIKFTVSKDGSIDTVVMEDKPTHIVISKVDITNEKELPGATLRIEDKDGNVIDEWVSTDKPHEIVGKLIADQEYTLIEITAPNGYLVAESIKFTVNHDGSVNKVVMKDARKPSSGGGGGGGGGETPKTPKHPITITKTNVENELLAGAEYGIYNESGRLISSGITSRDGRLTLYVAAGDYYIQEISAPSGYSLSTMKYPVTVRSDGTVEGKTDLSDDFAVVAISKLDIATLEPLENAEFTLFTMDGTPVATAVSGPEGYAEFRKVLYGDYYIMETGAPEGYILSPEKRYVTITKFYTNAPAIIWYNNPDTWVGRPRTGDESPIVPVALLLILTGAGYILFTVKGKKKKHKE